MFDLLLKTTCLCRAIRNNKHCNIPHAYRSFSLFFYLQDQKKFGTNSVESDAEKDVVKEIFAKNRLAKRITSPVQPSHPHRSKKTSKMIKLTQEDQGKRLEQKCDKNIQFADSDATNKMKISTETRHKLPLRALR